MSWPVVLPAGAWLAISICCEVVATSFLKASSSFTRPLPSTISVLGYAAAFFSLSHALRSVPMGIAYAIWSGAGIVLVTLVGWFWYGQKIGALELFAMGLIVAGAAILNLRS